MFTPPQALEAILFAAGEPLERKEVAKLLGISESQLQAVVEALAARLSASGLALIQTEHTLDLRTAPDAATFVKKLRESELSRDLGKAGLETLAVIAYHGGASRSEIDWVRGVNSSTSVRTLMLRGLIEGREDDKDHRRTRYVMTTEALAHLGVSRVEDLPRYSELAQGAKDVVEAETALASAEDTPTHADL